MMLTTIVFLGLAAAAALSDLRRRTVGNRLNLAIAAAGVAYQDAGPDPWAPLLGLAGIAVGLVILLPMFAARWLGGGDVKLLAAFGAWLGPVGVVWAAAVGLALGGVIALAMMLVAGAAVRREVTGNLGAALATGTAPIAPGRRRGLVVPLAVPLAAAAGAVFAGLV